MQVLCTTSTLAQGVNLPAHLVVLKGTRRWVGDKGDVPGNKEYDRSTILQMIGRAGRPQFDDEGVAVLMTQKEARGPNPLRGLCVRRACWRRGLKLLPLLDA